MKRMFGAASPLALLMPAAGAKAGETAKTTLTIKNMTCGGCVAAVKVQLKKTQGVTAYDVSLDKGEADVTFEPSRTTPEKIAASVSKTGFEASVRKAGEDKRREPEGGSSASVSEPEARSAVK